MNARRDIVIFKSRSVPVHYCVLWALANYPQIEVEEEGKIQQYRVEAGVSATGPSLETFLALPGIDISFAFRA
jgi:hypothetical protein